jgi:hypothetical protein
MTDITKLLEQLGSNFLKSALVPSLTFVIVSILLFNSLLSDAIAILSQGGISPLIGFWLFVFLFTVIVGFNLTALNTFILMIFEGKIVFLPLRFLYNRSRRSHLRTAYSLLKYRKKMEDRIRYIQETHVAISPESKKALDDLKDKYYQATSDYQLCYPDNLEDILPTKFGNILRAAEYYPGERYGFDGVHFWPRFLQFIPNDYQVRMNNIQNELSFHMNMCTLSVIFSSLCLVAAFYSTWNGIIGLSDSILFNESIRMIIKYLIAAALGFMSFGFFYNASISAASSFSMIIRSTSDLFRLDLLKKLGLLRPKDSIEEYRTWQKFNELIVLGSHSVSFTKMDYREDEK